MCPHRRGWGDERCQGQRPSQRPTVSQLGARGWGCIHRRPPAGRTRAHRRLSRSGLCFVPEKGHRRGRQRGSPWQNPGGHQPRGLHGPGPRRWAVSPSWICARQPPRACPPGGKLSPAPTLTCGSAGAVPPRPGSSLWRRELLSTEEAQPREGLGLVLCTPAP